MTITELEKMWSEFGDVPINSDDEIDFCWWEKRTCHFVPIKSEWNWFGEKQPNRIAEYAF